MNKYWIITKDVYLKNIKSVSFLIMLLAPFLALGVFYGIGQFSSDDSEDLQTGIVIQSGADEAKLPEVAAFKEGFTSYDSRQSGEKALKAEEIDGLLLLTIEENTVAAELLSEDTASQERLMGLNFQLSQLQTTIRSQALGLSPEEVVAINTPVSVNVQKVSFNEEGNLQEETDFSGIRTLVGMVSTILLFIFIMTYASIIAQEIASEKGTRIMEVILSSVSSRSHFYGKLSGILLVALTQVAVYVVSFGIGFYWIKDRPSVAAFLAEFSLKDIFGEFLLFTIIYLMLGIFIYAVLAALCGSLVSKVEDVSKAILPVTYLSLAGYMIGLTLGLSNPGHAAIRITSYIPFISSYTMPIRLANDNVPLLQIILSLAILVATLIILVMFSSKMYRSNVLIYNDNGIWAALKQSIVLMKNERKKNK